MTILQARPYNELPRSLHQAGDPITQRRGEGQQAVEIAYESARKDIERALARGTSMLVECDKILGEHVYAAIRKDLKNTKWFDVTYNRDQPAPPDTVMSQLLMATVRRLKEASENTQGVAVLAHLDLMAWTADGRPRPELNDLVYWFNEFPRVVKLAFWDPVFPIPDLARALFPSRCSLQSIDRGSMWRLITAEEARKLCGDGQVLTVSAQARLYQHVAGCNALEIRRILRGLVERNFAEQPSGKLLDDLYAYIREQTGASAVVSAEDLVGYQAIRERFTNEVIRPFRWRRDAGSAAELAQLEDLVPRGLFVSGPPGTGKSAWMKWLARELEAPLFVVHGPELKNKFVGETEAAIRRIFAAARRAAPSIILIDEIDALTPERSSTATNFERSMVAQFLAEMSGLRREEAVIVVGTTNRPESVDEAFLRPGRFRHVEIGYPDRDDRKAILAHHAEKLGLSLSCASLRQLAAETEDPIPLPGHAGDSRGSRFTGDHLREVCRNIKREVLLAREDKRAFDANDPGLLRKAVAAVRGLVSDATRSTTPTHSRRDD
jgi:DNA polymerase III delta prime subunit